MTDRIKGFVVTLEEDMRIDDIDNILNAIRMIKGISSVEPSISNIDDHINRERIKSEYREQFIKFYKENLK
jgi:hypothetical protein